MAERWSASIPNAVVASRRGAGVAMFGMVILAVSGPGKVELTARITSDDRRQHRVSMIPDGAEFLPQLSVVGQYRSPARLPWEALKYVLLNLILNEKWTGKDDKSMVIKQL